MSVATGGVTGALRGGAWASGLMAPMPSGVPNIAPGIVGWALSYVQPLESWFQELLGDPAQVEGVAASWDQVERTLVGVADELQHLEQQLEPLEGRTARTLALRYEDLRPAARDAADWSGAVAASARLASRVVAGVRQFIFEFLDSLARLIGALFGFSLNPLDKVKDLLKLANAATELVAAGRQLIANMNAAFSELAGLLHKLGPVVDRTIAELAEAMAQMLPIVGGLVGGGVLRDALTASGDVTRYDAGALDRVRFDIAGELEGARKSRFEASKLETLADLVQANSMTDRLGAADSTAIDVKLVRGPDGTEHWVVSLPSTQQWFDPMGGGAANDANTNIALMFVHDPNLASQYERAVLRAMREAGMAPDDRVVFTGFSQGGIMAARLAASTSLPYNTIGVVTNGSPIDTFKIPGHIPVVSFQHANDPVPILDGNIIGETPANVNRVLLPPPGGAADILAAHDNNNYASSIDKYASHLSDRYAWMGGEVIDHQVFEGIQR